MILNLTQHQATPEQVSQGVVDLPAAEREALQDLLTFIELPTAADVAARAAEIAELAMMNGLSGDEGDSPMPDAAMIGGAPFLMSALERALRVVGIAAIYAFSVRESVEQTQPDGSVIKIASFRHAGFVCIE